MPIHRPLAVLPLAALAVLARPAVVSGAQNAALSKYGATIRVTSKAPTPLNDRWNKPVDMLREKKPAGPIVNDLTTGSVRLGFPLPLHVVRIGILQGDYRGGFAKAKDFTVSAPGRDAKAFTLENAPGEVQLFDFAAVTDSVEIRFSSVYHPEDNPTRVYGSINQVQVLVSEDLAELFSPPDDYPRGLPVYVMRTPNLDPHKAPEVRGAPRKATRHPLTIWDEEDVAGMKRQIETHAAAREAYEGIVAFCEAACARPLAVPAKPDDGVDRSLAARHTKVATGIANLGIGYALSGREKYALEAKRMLVELSKLYEAWPIHGHPKFRHDSSKWSWQRLGDAIWLIPAAWGFDLIHNSPSLTDEDRAQIRDHFVMPCVRNIMRSSGIIASPTNWSAVCCAAVMVGSRVSGDEEFYEKSYKGLTRRLEDRKGGVFFHIDKGIDDDGMWAEGAIGYQFMAMRGLLVMAETLWHDGIDVYGYRDGRLKLVFDSPVWYCYPGGNSSPAIHDSGSSSLFNRDSHLYQYARRRYGEKAYNAILHKVKPTFESVYNLFLPACDFAPVEAADLPRVPSILFPGVGFATARSGDGEESKYLILDYGPKRSHGHPDKLGHCLYALGQELFADAGSAWYSTDIYKRYYSTTLAHNTVSANGTRQIMTGGRLEAYSSSGPYALVRASCDTAIPCTVLDRTLALSGDRLYDVYLVKSSVPFSFDLPYHCQGELEQSVATERWAEHPADAEGFAYYKDPVAAEVDGDWRCAWKVKRGRVEMRALGEPGTRVVFAVTPKGGDELPTAMLRRRTRDTVYATVCDIVPDGRGPSVERTRKLALEGNAAFLVECGLADGAREILLVNYTAGEVTLGGWTTDARVALVRLEGDRINAFTLCGATRLRGPEGSVEASAPALLSYRTVADGLAELSNQSDVAASVRMRGLARFDAAWPVGSDGKRGDRTRLARRGGVELELSPYGTLELTSGRQPTAAEHEERARRAKVEAALEAEARRRELMDRGRREQYARARESGQPAGYFVLAQAEDLARQGGGKVSVTDSKAAAYGRCFLKWDNRGHWIEYDVDVEHAGYYKLVMRYCREGGPVVRSLQIDGAFPHDAARRMEMDGTGGWSNGADNWEFYALSWPLIGEPYLVHLEAGRHTIRLENASGGGLNLDYFVLAPAGMEVTREAVER